MKPNGRTGLVVPTPAADDLLEIVRNLHPASVRPLPAHVSILYPFVPAVEISSELKAELESMATLVKPATVRVATCERHSGFVHLPVDAGHSLAIFRETVRRRWPELLPYGGVYGDPQLHLTVAKCSHEATATAIRHWWRNCCLSRSA